MKPYNSVREGIKKHGSSRAYFLTLKERAKSGLTTIEWDWYRARQREWEPDVLAAEQEATRKKMDMDHARRLSVDELREILREKEGGHDLQAT